MLHYTELRLQLKTDYKSFYIDAVYILAQFYFVFDKMII